MKLIIDLLENPCLIEESCVTSLHIADKHLYSNIILKLLYAKEEKSTSVILFNDKGKELLTTKDILLITSPFSFDFNSKDIQTKIIQILEYNINFDVENKNIVEQKYNDFLNAFIAVSDLYESNLSIELDFNVKKIIKATNIRIDVNIYLSAFENVLKILETVSSLNLTSLVIFIGLKNFLNYEELEKIYLHCIYHKIKVLLVDQRSSSVRLSNEKIILIDSDFDWIEL